MKSKCGVIFLVILIQVRGMDLQDKYPTEETVFIGDPFHYNCSYADLNFRLNEMKDEDEINIARPYEGTLKLSFEKTYEFDNNFVLNCKTKRITIIKIDEKTPNNSGLMPKEYNYKVGNTENFECKRTRDPTIPIKNHDGLHWFLIKELIIHDVADDFMKWLYFMIWPAKTDYIIYHANMAKTSSDYVHSNLTYSRKFTKEDDGSKLFCFYFKCDEVNNIITCTRYVQTYIVLKSTNDTSILGFKTDLYKGVEEPGLFLYAIAGAAITVLILVAAVVWYCRRKAQIKDNVEYCEIDLSSVSQTPVPVKKDEIIYSKVKGVLLPTQNTIPNPPLSQQLRGSEMKASPILL